MRIFTSICVLLLMASCGSESSMTHSQAANGNQPTYVRVPVAMLSPAWVQTHQFNRDHATRNSYALGWLPAGEMANLSSSERSALNVLDAYKVARGSYNPFTLEDIPADKEAATPSEDYHNYAAMTQELQNLAGRYSNIAQLESIGKSVQGRDLWLMKISKDVAVESTKPKLLYIFNMHGDEVVGRELGIYQIRRLLSEYGTDPRISHLVDNAQIYLMPSMNPDGFEMHQRYNANSVDLNRDFPDFTSDDHDNTGGRAIETAAVMALHAKHHFVSAINFHGGEVCFNLPWDTKPNNSREEKFADDNLLAQMARAYADSNPTMKSNNNFDRGVTYGFEWYEVNGGMQDWSIYYRRSMHATVELSFTKWPSASQLPTFWSENRDAMLAHLERGLVGIHLEVVDSQGQPVNGATVSVNSSTRSLTYDGNVAHRPTVNGAQVVTVAANGYKTATIQANAQSFNGVLDRVVLTR